MTADIFVQNVERLCKVRGTTPTVACAESGAGKDMVSDAKRRKSIPSVIRVQKLATFLGVSTSDLLGEKKEPALVSETQPTELSTTAYQIAIAYDRANEKEKSMARLLFSIEDATS